jgi:Flp pilus assembly protein TadG
MSHRIRRSHIRGVVSRWRRQCVFIFSAQGGLAAVEFALILPFMLITLLGTFEITQGIAAKRQVVLAASTVANLVTQYTTISASETMPDILNAAGTVLTPYSVSNAIVTVSSISINASGQATVAWSQSLNGTARPVGQVVSIPAALNVPNSSLVMGETTYAYNPVIDFMNIGRINLYYSVYMLPRTSGSITLGP